MVQLIDTPPITADYLEPYMQGMIRGADLALLHGRSGQRRRHRAVPGAARPAERARRPGWPHESHLDEEDVGLSYTQTLLVPNKIDLPDAAERLELLHELCPLDFAEHVISAEHGTGLEELRNAIYQALDVVRVYTKLPTAQRGRLRAALHDPPRRHAAATWPSRSTRTCAENSSSPASGAASVHDGTRRQGRLRAARQGHRGAARVKAS